MPETLTTDQIENYRRDGYLVLERHIPLPIIEAIRSEITRFEGEARGMTASDERLDLEESHQPDAPRIRRVKQPHRLSDVIKDLLFSDHILAPARDLLGNDIRLHNTKLNMKSKGYGAAIEWHQDVAFYPHTNDDVLAIGVVIDDMALENGPLTVFPGSHQGPTFDHHQDGVFVGALDFEGSGLDMANSVTLTAPAGSISIHHGRMVHGSAKNTSDRDRRMLFLEMMAADAFPVMGSMTTFDSIEEYNTRMLCGEPTLHPRLSDWPVRIPQPQPELNRSIYEVQSGLKRPAFGR